MRTGLQRLRQATLAMLIGWMAGFFVTSPFQIAEVLRNSGSNLPLLLSALGYGFAVWMMITLAAIAVIWVCIILPIALLVRAPWLVRRRRAVIAVSMGLSVLVISYMVHVWTHFYHDGIGLMNFEIYAGFAAAFSGVTSYSYLRLLARDPKP
jgi:hypothetical protein